MRALAAIEFAETKLENVASAHIFFGKIEGTVKRIKSILG
jgi:hypothetical protein